MRAGEPTIAMMGGRNPLAGVIGLLWTLGCGDDSGGAPQPSDCACDFGSRSLPMDWDCKDANRPEPIRCECTLPHDRVANCRARGEVRAGTFGWCCHPTL